MKIYGVILAAGESIRFDAKINKLFYKVNDKELIRYPVETFLKNENIDEVIIVSSELNKSKEYCIDIDTISDMKISINKSRFFNLRK